jgi:hypothetical protein
LKGIKEEVFFFFFFSFLFFFDYMLRALKKVYMHADGAALADSCTRSRHSFKACRRISNSRPRLPQKKKEIKGKKGQSGGRVRTFYHL